VAAVDAVLATAQRAHNAAESGQAELFGGNANPEPLVIPDVAVWLPAERLQREFDAIGFFLSGHPLDDYAGVLKGLQVQSWTAFSRAVKAGVTAGKLAATVVSRAERRSKTGNKIGIIGLSDPSAQYEAVIFAEGLAQYRDQLEPGSPVLLYVTAEAQGEEVRARIQTVEPLDRAAAKLQRGLRIFVRDEAPLEAVAKRLGSGRDSEAEGRGSRSEGASARPGLAAGERESEGSGEVNLVVMLSAGAEVEVRLPGRYKVTPQIAGAIKAVPGVVEVQAV
jgi:DNA polymerase III subunit alpha